MSAYRNKPPPPRWRSIYRVPFIERVSRGAVLGGFGVMAMSALLALGVFAAIGKTGSGTLVGLGAFSVMVFVTGGAVVALHWLTSFAGTDECTVDALYVGDTAKECLAWSGSRAWILPIPREQLREGQTIRVRYRDVAQDNSVRTDREILEIKVIDE